MDALAFMPATELAARIRDGSFTAREVTEATIRRIEAVDPQIGAFVELDAEAALEQAAQVSPGDRRPFAGVPIAVKANTAVAGMCMNFASRFLAGHRPTHSAYLVRRLREAGFVIVGTTNMPEFGILPTTEPRHNGPTRNPWGLERTPGGSSGGSAAARLPRPRRRDRFARSAGRRRAAALPRGLRATGQPRDHVWRAPGRAAAAGRRDRAAVAHDLR